MVRYPYTLWVATAPVAVKDSGGDYTAPGLTVLNEVSPCRDEPAGTGQVLTLEDGTAVLFSSVVYMPLSCADILVGSSIEVRKLGVGRRAWGTVKRFERNQLHCTLWV